MRRDQKEQVVEELTARLKAADTLLVADYRGLTMPQIDELRSRLLESGARFTVVKNTLTRRAAEAAGTDALLTLLDGPSAIAFLEADGDMVAAAKALADSARETQRARDPRRHHAGAHGDGGRGARPSRSCRRRTCCADRCSARSSRRSRRSPACSTRRCRTSSASSTRASSSSAARRRQRRSRSREPEAEPPAEAEAAPAEEAPAEEEPAAEEESAEDTTRGGRRQRPPPKKKEES